MARASLIVLALLTATLSACAALPRPVEKPTVDVRGVAIASVSLSGLEGELALDIFNPNSFAVPLSGVDWELTVGDARAVRGSVDLSRNIPARDHAPVIGTLQVDARDAVDVGRAIAAGRKQYVVRGTLHFSTTLGPIAVTFEHRGDIDDARSLAWR